MQKNHNVMVARYKCCSNKSTNRSCKLIIYNNFIKEMKLN